MRFLGIGETNELGDMYLRLAARGHAVKVFVADQESKGVMEGMLEFTPDWKAELDWISAAGREGLILFETASDGLDQDGLRAQGYNVIGGSAVGDRLEGDRAYGQKILSDFGIIGPPTHLFDDFDDAMKFVRSANRRYVLKLNGTDWSSTSTYTGQLESGEDMIAVLRATKRRLPSDERVSFILMEYISGVEVGVGAFFNGREFLTPANLDWEHKRFFPGDLGELTGEMGTVVTYRGAEIIFEATLAKLKPILHSSGYCGYINLNTIVNDKGIWPLEFTCRFGYPGFPILDALHLDGWDDLFGRMITGKSEFRTRDGFSVGVVVTVPSFPYSLGYEVLGKGMPVCFRAGTTNQDKDAIHWGEVAMRDGDLVTEGLVGYIAVVTGAAETIEGARDRAYATAKKVVIPNVRYRLDIGEKLLREDLNTLKELGWLNAANGD